MKKTLLGLLVVGLVAAAGVTARAQSTDPALVKIPFKFVVAGKLLPAGDYRITTLAADSSVLQVTNLAGGGPSVFVPTVRVPNPLDSTSGKPSANVVFKTYGGQRFLSIVMVTGDDAREVPLKTGVMDQMLARLNLSPAERADAGAR